MYCPKCGKEIPENDKFCPYCGFTVNNSSGPAAHITEVSDKTSEFSAEDINRTRYLSAVCYLGLLFVILALVIEPGSKFIRYHINQSILITILGIASAIVCIIPIIGWIAGIAGSIAVFVFTVMGIVRAFSGKAEDLPIIGKYVIIHYD